MRFGKMRAGGRRFSGRFGRRIGTRLGPRAYTWARHHVVTCVLSGLNGFPPCRLFQAADRAFLWIMGFSGLHRVVQWKRPGKSESLQVGALAVGNWGQCLPENRHPTAQAERIRWRPHLEALQIGSSICVPTRSLVERSSSVSQTLLDRGSTAGSRVRRVTLYDRGWSR